jgi:hypothetical protein
MTNTRIKIDLGHGIVEAEGSEEFVRSIYEDYKNRLESTTFKSPLEPSTSGIKRETKSATQPATKKKKGGSRGNPSLITSMDLSGGGKVESLRDFYAKYKPTSNFHRNLVFIYYLTNNLGMTGVNVDHVYTCYRDIQGIKTPNVYQSILDTTRYHGWLDSSSTEDIKVTIKGMNYLEHDMPKSESE